MNAIAWQHLAFEEAVRDVSGGNRKVQKSDYLRAGAYPVVDQGQELIGGYCNDKECLVSSSGPWVVFGDHTRGVKYIDRPFCMGADGVKVLTPRDPRRLDAKFLYWFLAANEVPSAGYSRHFKFLKRLHVPIPPLDEQRRIAAILDKADALRQKRKRAIALLDSLTQSMFLEMFGDPIRNPMKWRTAPLASFCETRLGKMLDQKKMEGLERYPYLANYNVQWGRFVLDEVREMGFSAAEQVEFELRDEDLLVCEGGEIGRSAVWDASLGRYYFQKALHRVRPDQEIALSSYLQWFFWFMAVGGGLASHTATATIAHLTGERLRKLPVPLPPIAHQRAFTDAVSKMGDVKNQHTSSLAQIEALFASLQHRAFSGQL